MDLRRSGHSYEVWSDRDAGDMPDMHLEEALACSLLRRWLPECHCQRLGLGQARPASVANPGPLMASHQCVLPALGSQHQMCLLRYLTGCRRHQALQPAGVLGTVHLDAHFLSQSRAPIRLLHLVPLEEVSCLACPAFTSLSVHPPRLILKSRFPRIPPAQLLALFATKYVNMFSSQANDDGQTGHCTTVAVPKPPNKQAIKMPFVSIPHETFTVNMRLTMYLAICHSADEDDEACNRRTQTWHVVTAG